MILITLKFFYSGKASYWLTWMGLVRELWVFNFWDINNQKLHYFLKLRIESLGYIWHLFEIIYSTYLRFDSCLFVRMMSGFSSVI